MSTESKDLDVEAEIDRLYQLPLDAFVAARNALAARLKACGDKDGTARVKALVRPSIPAWAANQVYWSARPEFDALLASVERLRQAQQGAAGGTALREAMKARREAQDLVLRAASARLASAGHGAKPDTLHRVSNTMEALAARGARSAEARPGRLVQDLEPPGFDALASVAGTESPSRGSRLETAAPASAAPAASQPKADHSGAKVDQVGAVDVIARDQLRLALAESEKRLDLARRQAREAAGAHSVAEKRAEAARAELIEATRRLERAKERAAVTAEDEAATRRTAEEMAAARDSAEADRDEAVSALRGVE
jgi:hypothetical protein